MARTVTCRAGASKRREGGSSFATGDSVSRRRRALCYRSAVGSGARDHRKAQHEERRVAALHRRQQRHAVHRRSIRSTPRTSASCEVAWRFKTDNLGPRPEYKLEGHADHDQGRCSTRPAARGDRSSSLDGQTGEVNWVHSLREGKRAAVSPRQLSGRGVSYWTDGKGDERIVYVTTGYRLVELDARTGSLITSFGNGRHPRLEGRAS